MTKRRKQEINKIEIIKGQLSIWDVEITNKPTSFTKTAEKVTENAVSFSENTVLFTKIPSKDENTKIEKPLKPLELTEKQQQFLDKNKVMENENLTRIIKYCGGGLGVELGYENSVDTIYINTNGDKEFTSPKKMPVLPMDRIMYYKSALIEFNNTQEQKLKELLSNIPEGKVIRRKGDENIIIEAEDKIISIIPKGWALEFNGSKAVYSDDEVEKKEDAATIDLKELQQSVKVGDIVEAKLISRTITGKITHVYGMHNMTLNISLDNGTKHTAIPRCVVTRILN